MPTYNRRHYVPQAIQYFLRQSYPNRELIITDDGTDCIQDVLPADPRIRYIRLDTRMILGAKRNLGCKLAQGTIIAHWDDDDWMAPHRLHAQITLLERQQAEMCGAYRQIYYDPQHDKSWLYEYPPSGRRLPIGNTLCYRKSLWNRNPFPEIAIGEDTRFIWSSTVKSIALLADHTCYIGLIHNNNTSRKILTSPCWHPHPVQDVYRLLSTDQYFYRHPLCYH